MKKLINKVYDLIDKIGKQNFMLITFLILVGSIFGLYQTFSIFTSSDGVSLIDGIKTFKFILNENNEETSITVAAGVSKNIAITVSNKEKMNLRYGIYYSSSNDLTNVDLGYLYDSEYLPNGIIPPEKDYVVTIKIDNNSESNVTITFGTIYGTENGGELELASNQNFLDIKYLFALNEVEPGSYVKYIGNNGCTGASCSGQNANYVNEEDMGSCWGNTHKYQVNGWRIGYVKDNNSYLVSSASPQCLCTNPDGTTSAESCTTDWLEATKNLHFTNLDNTALGYCNAGFSSENSCDTTTAWNMTGTDFSQITSSEITSCHDKPELATCGSGNSLIDIGGYYWFKETAPVNGTTSGSYSTFIWFPYHSTVGYKFIGATLAGYPIGIRHVMKLSSSVKVLSGTGTYKDPYIIDNPDTVRDLSGNMNNGVPKNGLSWDQENGSIRTDGTTSFLHAGLKNYNFNNSISLVIRMKVNSHSSNSSEQDIFNNYESGGVGFYMTNQKLNFSIFTDQYYTYHSTFSPTVNTWYTFVGIYDGKNLSLYANGELLPLDTSNTSATNVTTGNIKSVNLPFIIGGNPSPDGNVYALSDITVEDAMIFDRALTEEEIVNNYSSIPNPTNKEGLLLHYDFKR